MHSAPQDLLYEGPQEPERSRRESQTTFQTWHTWMHQSLSVDLFHVWQFQTELRGLLPPFVCLGRVRHQRKVDWGQ